MSRTQFTILTVFLSLILIMVGGNMAGLWSKSAEIIIREPPGDNCSVCGRDQVTAHGGILLKNSTQREVEIRVRHHPGESELVVRLDPNGLRMVDNVLVGIMKLRALGDGFDEESFCTITPNTQHEMWWKVTGFEMHGTMQMHMGH